ncbi:MAG: SDR family oxidoreductase [Actinobacteria bacterium]|nr:SDR family oxidoreductase [Actinomycetota bacterium]
MRTSVVVTGAARGIGRAIAEEMAGNGTFTVIAVDIAPEPGFADDSIVPVQVDLTTEDGISEVVAAVESAGCPLTGLVNNAGITRDSRLVNMTDEDFGSVLDVNLGAAYRLSTAMADLMSDGGAIVNISSRSYLGNFGQFNYSMSKGGLVGLTRAMAVSLAPHIRVNAVAPGLIDTEMTQKIPEEVLERAISNIPMARMGTPDEIADVVWFLLTPLSSYVTGHVLVVGGGRSLS